jgi:hypothetical protein
VSWTLGSVGDTGFADGGSASEADSDSDWDEIPDHECGPPPGPDSEQPARISVAAVRSALDARSRSDASAPPPPPPPGDWMTLHRGLSARGGLRA